MIEDEFFATIKLKYSGEEIFAKVAVSEEEDCRTFLILTNPIVIEEVTIRGNVCGLKMEPWLKTSSEDTIILNKDDILTISESNNMQVIFHYNDYVRKMHKINYSKLNREMGFLGTVEEHKKALEKLFNIKDVNS